MFVEKLMIGLPNATKGQNLKQEEQGDIKAHLTKNEVIVIVIVKANLVAHKID